MDPITWLNAHVSFRPSNAADFWYERMESQSGRNLPVIYYPFDGTRRSDFTDRGQILDFALSVGTGRVLDFGPGDGWPALLIAPWVTEVVGVDGSVRRVQVCAENAVRLGLRNTRFVRVPPGEALPFADRSFDGITAASSLEQTPDPRATLRELYRVLAPGGRLRLHYESLAYYAGGHEREIAQGDRDERPARLLLFDRHIAQEYVEHYALLCDLSGAELRSILAPDGSEPGIASLSVERLERLRPRLVDAATWRTQHPSCATWLRWLAEAGFSSARPTYDGGWFAQRLFERLPSAQHPRELAAVDALLRPLVEVVLDMEAPVVARPGAWEPWITASK